MKNKKIIIVSSAIIACGLIAFFTIFNFTKTKIGFYDIPENAKASIEKNLLKEFPKVRFSFKTIKSLSKNSANNFDLVFTLNSRTAVDIAGFPISTEIMNHFPTTIKYSTFQNNQNYAMPLLFDHFELMIYRTYMDQCNLTPPETFSELKEYLRLVKEKADFPMIAIGTDDRELFGFVSSIVLALYGVEEYFEVCVELNRAQARLEELPYRIRMALDEIKRLESEGLLHKNWLKATFEDINFLMNQHQLGSIATFLSTQRQFSYVLEKYYDSILFPQDVQPFGLIAPEICVIKTNKNPNLDKILKSLASAKIQTELSKDVMLAPSASVAESNDVQSDNVRFWCAATKAGAIPAFSESSFVTPERLKTYAKKIREYLN